MYRDPRVRTLNNHPVNEAGHYVLYHARANHRVAWNHALSFAVRLANERKLPVLFCEELPATKEPYACERFCTFAQQGMEDNLERTQKVGIGYSTLLETSKAAAIVSDDHPLHRDPAYEVAAYAVDSSCIVPMSLFEKREYAAFTIRPKIHKRLAEFLKPLEPLRVKVRWTGTEPKLSACRMDPSVPASLEFRGGPVEAEARLKRFLKHNLHRYARHKNEPSERATSDLSPYLRFGHLSSLQVALDAKAHAEENGMIIDEFLEELIVRRELAYNFAKFTESPDAFENLPEWVRLTLKKHEKDRRDPRYSLEEFESAQTHDELWNACQKELLLIGKIHGYYRMYWGKKIIEWSKTPREALKTMVHLNDKYALDGRDPNGYSNMLWCFGLHDRPWFERPIFGTVRYMALSGMSRKTDVSAYIQLIQQAEAKARS